MAAALLGQGGLSGNAGGCGGGDVDSDDDGDGNGDGENTTSYPGS